MEFEEERDLNWARLDRPQEFPSVTYEFTLDGSERAKLVELENSHRRYVAAQNSQDQLTEAAREARAAAVDAQQAATLAKQTVDSVAAEAETAQVAADADPGDSDLKEQAAATNLALAESRTAATLRLDQAEDASGSADDLEKRPAQAENWRALADVLLSRDASEIEMHSDEAKAKLTASQGALRDAQKAVAEAHAEKERADQTTDDGEIERTAEALAAAERSLDDVHDDLNSKIDLAATAALAADAARDLASESNAEPDLSGIDRAVQADLLDTEHAPETIAIQRTSVGTDLAPAPNPQISEPASSEFLSDRIPRVEIIRPVQNIPDSVDLAELDHDASAFMRGVFYYAGVDRDDWQSLFTQDYGTTRRLRDASQDLDRQLRRAWSQGSELTFRLIHDSQASRINLQIQDPAVSKRDVRASRRSSGFTHFFALKTILHAHQHESHASSYIWLFDEPGVYLTPEGQYNPTSVLETLSLTNQLVYTTHSIFMANKNHPTRHRLIVKTEHGTTIDSKPSLSSWKPSLEALGLSLPGTILFASRILLVEGDSDPILIYAILQKPLQLRKIDVDLNPLGVVAIGESGNAEALIRMLREANIRPKLAALFDGDDGGRARQKNLASVLESYDVGYHVLTSGTAIEDHIPLAGRIYVDAVAEYVAEVSHRDAEVVRTEIVTRFEEELKSRDNLTSGISKRSRIIGKEAGDLNQEPSAVGIARAYAEMLMHAAPERFKDARSTSRSVKLAEWIAEALELAPQTLEQDRISR